MSQYGIDLMEIGVERGEGESWQELVNRRTGEQGQELYFCPCGAGYHSRAARLRCCSERFD